MSSKTFTQASDGKLDIFNVKQEVCNADQIYNTNLIQNDETCATNTVPKDIEGATDSIGSSSKSQRLRVRASPSLRGENLTESPRKSQSVSPRREHTKEIITRSKASDEDSEGPSDIRIEKDKIVIKINLKNLKKKRKKSKRKKYKNKKNESHDVVKKSKKVSVVSVNIENSVNYSISDPSDQSSTNSIDNSVDTVDFVAGTNAMITSPPDVDVIDDGLIRINSGHVLQNKYSLRNPPRYSDINSQLSQKILELTHQTLHMNYSNSLLSSNKPMGVNRDKHISCTSTSQMNAEPSMLTQSMISSKAHFAKVQNCQSIREILQQSSVDYRVNTSQQKYLDKFNNNFQVQCNLNQSRDSRGNEYIVDLTHEERGAEADDEFMDINELQAFIPYETYLKQINERSHASRAKSNAINSPKRAAKAPVPNLIRIDKNICEIRDITPISNLKPSNKELLNKNALDIIDVLANKPNKTPSSPLLRSQTKQKSLNSIPSQNNESNLQADSSATDIASTRKKFIDRSNAIVLRSSEEKAEQVQFQNNSAQFEFVVPSTKTPLPHIEKSSICKSTHFTSSEKTQKIVISKDSCLEKNPEILINSQAESIKSVETMSSSEITKTTDAIQIKLSPIKSSLRSFRKQDSREMPCENYPTENRNHKISPSNLDVSVQEKTCTKLPQESGLDKTSPTETTSVPTLSSKDGPSSEKKVEEEVDRISPIMLSQIIKKMQLEADLRHEQQCSSKDVSKTNDQPGSKKDVKDSSDNMSNQGHVVKPNLNQVEKEISHETDTSNDYMELTLVRDNNNISKESNSLKLNLCNKISGTTHVYADKDIRSDHSESDKKNISPAKPTTELSTQETLFEALNLFKDQNHLPRRQIRKQTEINNLLEELEKLDSNEQDDASTNETTDQLTQPLERIVENQSDRTIDHIFKFLGNMMKHPRSPNSIVRCEPKINPSLVQALALSVNASENNLQKIDDLNTDDYSNEHKVSKFAGESTEVLRTRRKSNRISNSKETLAIAANEDQSNKLGALKNKAGERETTTTRENYSSNEVLPSIAKNIDQVKSPSISSSEQNVKQVVKNINEPLELVSPKKDGLENVHNTNGVFRKSLRIRSLKEPSTEVNNVQCDNMEICEDIKANNELVEVGNFKFNDQNHRNSEKLIEKVQVLDETVASSSKDSEDNLKKAIESCKEIEVKKHKGALQNVPETNDVTKTRKSNRILKQRESTTMNMTEIASKVLEPSKNISVNDELTEKIDGTQPALEDINKEISSEKNKDLDLTLLPNLSNCEDNIKHAIDCTDDPSKELELVNMRKSDRLRKLKELPLVKSNIITSGEMNTCESSCVNKKSAEQENINSPQNESIRIVKNESAKDLNDLTNIKMCNADISRSHLLAAKDMVSQEKPNRDINILNETIISKSILSESHKKVITEELNRDILDSSLENDKMDIDEAIETTLRNETPHAHLLKQTKGISSNEKVKIQEDVLSVNMKTKVESCLKVDRRSQPERKSPRNVQKKTKKCIKKDINGNSSKCKKKGPKRSTMKMKNNEVSISSKSKNKSHTKSFLGVLEIENKNFDLIERMEKLNLKSNDSFSVEEINVSPIKRDSDKRKSTQTNEESRVDVVNTTKKKRKTKKIKYIAIAKVSTKYERKKKRMLGKSNNQTVTHGIQKKSIPPVFERVNYKKVTTKDAGNTMNSANLKKVVDSFSKTKRNKEKSSKLNVSSAIIPPTLPEFETLKRSTRRSSIASISSIQSELPNFLPPAIKLIGINRNRLRQSVTSSVDSTIGTDQMKCVRQDKQDTMVDREKSKKRTKKVILKKQKVIKKGKILKKKPVKRSLRLRGLRKRDVLVRDTKNYRENLQIVTIPKCPKPKAELNNNEYIPGFNYTKTEKNCRKRRFDKDEMNIKEEGECKGKFKKYDLTKVNKKQIKSSSKPSKQNIQEPKTKKGKVGITKSAANVQKKLRQSVRLRRHFNQKNKNKKDVGAKSRVDDMVCIDKRPVKENKKVQKVSMSKLKTTKAIKTKLTSNIQRKSQEKLSTSKTKSASQVKDQPTDISIVKNEKIGSGNIRNQETVIDIHSVIGQIILKKKINKSNTQPKLKEKDVKNEEVIECENALPQQTKSQKSQTGRKPKVFSAQSKLEMEVEKDIPAPVDVYDFQDDLETVEPPVSKQCKLEPGTMESFKQKEKPPFAIQNKVPTNSEILKGTSDEINTKITSPEQHKQIEFHAPIEREQEDQHTFNKCSSDTIEASRDNVRTIKESSQEPIKIVSKRDKHLYNVIQNIKTELREKLIKTEVTKTAQIPNTHKLTLIESHKTKCPETNPIHDDVPEARSAPNRRLTQIREEPLDNQIDILPVAGSSTSEPTAGEFNAELLSSMKIKTEQLKYYDAHRPQASSAEDVKDIKSVLLTCPLCEKIYRSQFRLKQHLRKRHVGEVFDCDCCREYFVDRTAFDEHMRSHDDGISCRHCGDKFPKPMIREHLMLHVKEDQRGSVTDACFNKKQTSLLTHYLKQRGMKLQCTRCTDTFCPRSNMLRHYLAKHSSDKIFYSCHRCEKRFSMLQNLKRHLAIHEGLTYTCNVCDRTYSRMSDYKIHMRMHTGLRFQCPVCLKCASRASYLKKHMIMIHGRVSGV